MLKVDCFVRILFQITGLHWEVLLLQVDQARAQLLSDCLLKALKLKSKKEADQVEHALLEVDLELLLGKERDDA